MNYNEIMEEKTCLNCIHCIRHYCKHGTTLRKTAFWHCEKIRKQKKDIVSCPEWKLESDNEQQKQAIFKKLEKMADNINDILFILNEESPLI